MLIAPSMSDEVVHYGMCEIASSKAYIRYCHDHVISLSVLTFELLLALLRGGSTGV